PQALKAAWRVGFWANPPLPAGGVPECVPGLAPFAAPDGGVTPCCSRHLVNAARLLLDADADVDVVVLLEALEPHAAISPVEATAAMPSASRRGRAPLGWGKVMFSFLCSISRSCRCRPRRRCCWWSWWRRS